MGMMGMGLDRGIILVDWCLVHHFCHLEDGLGGMGMGLPSLKLTAKACENGWLEDDISFWGWPIWRGELLVSGSGILKLLKYPPDVYLQYTPKVYHSPWKMDGWKTTFLLGR